MTTAQRQAAIARTRQRIAELNDALQAALVGGVQSASLSSAGNSQSYTRYSPAELRKEIARLEAQLEMLEHGRVIRRSSPSFLYGNWMGC